MNRNMNKYLFISIRPSYLLIVTPDLGARAEIHMPTGTMEYYPDVVTPTEGGGTLSPLFSNIYLNELDTWMEGQIYQDLHNPCR